MKNINQININSRRKFLQTAGTLGAATSFASLSCLAQAKSQGKSAKGSKVVIVGAGFGGASAAKYLRMWSNNNIEVTLIEPAENFISCPISNLVLAGYKTMEFVTHSYSALNSRWGVKLVKDTVSAIDTNKKTVKTAIGTTFAYDRLILSPGIDFNYSDVKGMNDSAMQNKVLHAWKAGKQTVALRKQLESIKDGGVFAISIPRSPFRCPPGPYERACVVADYFKKHKPKSKVIVLDANEKIQSKESLFKAAWSDLYKDNLEYFPDSQVQEVKSNGNKITAITDFDQGNYDLLNLIPPQKAGKIVIDSGAQLINDRWAEVDWLSMESTNLKNVHIIGDAVFPAPTMPKSGHMANQHAKLVAAAIINLLEGEPVNPDPLLMNTCYSFANEKEVFHIASIHTYDKATKLFQPVKGAGGLSARRNQLELNHAFAWANNIWADVLL